jgi:hypothetical protein
MNCSLCGRPSVALDDGSQRVRAAGFVILNPGPGLAPGTAVTLTVKPLQPAAKH